MIRTLFRLARHARRAARREEGSASVEFVILFPMFMILFVSCFESAMLMTRQVMLERAVDLSVRGLRLGTWTPPTHTDLKKNICRLAGIIPDCMNVILVELRPVSTETWSPLNNSPTCVDRSQAIQPVTTVDGGLDNEMMLVRACVKVKPLFPATGLGMILPKDGWNSYALVSTSAFVNEPS